MRLRAIEEKDRSEIAELIYCSINVWYRSHGWPEVFRGGPEVTDVFYQVYQALDPGCAVVAENPHNGRLMGSCFYHPREHHVALGIMNVHPNYFGRGVGKALLQFIIDYTGRNEYRSLRLTQSALNLDSFSLYNRAGFVPRHSYQDMMVPVPSGGLAAPPPAGLDRVRDATAADVEAMSRLEFEVSGVTRVPDYEYVIRNSDGLWHVSVSEDGAGQLGGFMISCAHPAMNMIGPGVARSEGEAAALLYREFDLHRGRTPAAVVPMEAAALVNSIYDWGGRNTEMHFCQVRGEFRPFRGLNFPSFLPETA